MDKRQFIKTLGIGGIGLVTGCATRGSLKKLLNQIDLENGQLLSELKNYVVESNTVVNYFMNNYEGKIDQKGMGVRYKNYYLTLKHIVDFSDGVPVNSPFGVFNVIPERLEFHTEIKGKKLEKITFEEEDDLAIFKVPKDLDALEFPLEPKEDLQMGERIADIGNPHLMGFNCRIGRISDLDGINIKGYTNSVGTDLYVIPGDSGTPLISLSDRKLIGLMGLHFSGLSYFQPMRNFLKHLKQK